MNPDAFSVARRDLTDRLIRLLGALFLQPGSWRAGDVDVFLAQAVPAVAGAQRSLAALTAVYVAGQASDAVGRTIAAPGIPDSAAVDLRKDVDATAVYRRPYASVYAALAEGKPLGEAVDLGATRLSEITELDLQQTYAEASRAALHALPSDATPRFWRRELVGPENCGMCIVASTQRYRVETLSPIHPGCDCRVQPIFGADPGQVIDDALLEQTHTAVEALTGQVDRGGRAPDYRKIVLTMTKEHGELGPMLARPLDSFTSQNDL